MANSHLKSILKTMRDYVPKGRIVTPDEVRKAPWREVEDGEICYCHQRVANDIQSGPIYCGDLADFTADFPDNHCLSFCARHFRQKRLQLGGEQEQEKKES